MTLGLPVPLDFLVVLTPWLVLTVIWLVKE